MISHRQQPATRHARRGSILPAVALALLVSGGCLALVLNDYWLMSAQEELRTAAQGAALAAANELACDELLKLEPDHAQIAQAARDAAARIAERSVVAGRTAAAVDVLLGRVIFDSETGAQQTLQTDYFPTSILVLAHRDRAHGNPVPLMAPFLTGRQSADVSITAEASISNRISAVRPIESAGVPAWPIAVLEASPDPRIQTWSRQIEQRAGSDRYGWDDVHKRVISEPDGLTEIVLRAKSQNGTSNLVLVDLGAGLSTGVLQRQFERGWTAADLADWGGEFPLQDCPLTLRASDDFSGPPEQLLEGQIGQPHLFLLYAPLTSAGDTSQIQVTRMVAGRILDISWSEQGPQIVLQAAVVATRTAVLDQDALLAGESQGNPYVYRLSITQ